MQMWIRKKIYKKKTELHIQIPLNELECIILIVLSEVSKYIRASSDYLMLQKAPGEQHCFTEQCQSKENNQKGHNFIFTTKTFKESAETHTFIFNHIFYSLQMKTIPSNW